MMLIVNKTLLNLRSQNRTRKMLVLFWDLRFSPRLISNIMYKSPYHPYHQHFTKVKSANKSYEDHGMIISNHIHSYHPLVYTYHCCNTPVIADPVHTGGLPGQRQWMAGGFYNEASYCWRYILMSLRKLLTVKTVNFRV